MTLTLGTHGEQLVARHLIEQGFAILATNYRCQLGELDIIARNKNLIAVVEVKTRTTPGQPVAEMVTRTKQHKIIAATRHYLAFFPQPEQIIRFDVAYVCNEIITYIPNAFTAHQW
jgi:putative endonuclease